MKFFSPSPPFLLLSIFSKLQATSDHFPRKESRKLSLSFSTFRNENSPCFADTAKSQKWWRWTFKTEHDKTFSLALKIRQSARCGGGSAGDLMVLNRIRKQRKFKGLCSEKTEHERKIQKKQYIANLCLRYLSSTAVETPTNFREEKRTKNGTFALQQYFPPEVTRMSLDLARHSVSVSSLSDGARPGGVTEFVFRDDDCRFPTHNCLRGKEERLSGG